MSGEFSSLSFLADLDLKECQKCGKPTESTKLKDNICPKCQQQVSQKELTPSIPKRSLIRPRETKSRTSSKAVHELESKISEQQEIIQKITSDNVKLHQQLINRISQLETGLGIPHPIGQVEMQQVTSSGIKVVDHASLVENDRINQEKVVIAFYSFENKLQQSFTLNQVTDQLLLKMVVLVETFLNSAEQIQAIQIICDNYIQDGKETPISDVNEYIRASPVSFRKTFLPLSNKSIRKLGRRAFHCEILEKTYNDVLVPVYKPTDLGKQFFAIRTHYFDKAQVLKRIKSMFGRKLIAKKGVNLYKVINDHYTMNNKPVTRQELFNQYELGKYEIDNFKHNLIEVGLIKKVPLPYKTRYNADQQLPTYEIALQPRFPEITPINLRESLGML